MNRFSKLKVQISSIFIALVLLAATPLRSQMMDSSPSTTQQQQGSRGGDVGVSLDSTQITPRNLNGSQTQSTDNNLPVRNDQFEQPKNTDIPPTELTGFQRMVAASIGKILPIYGANLFSGVPSTFAPIDRVPVTLDYAIGPGDELLIRMWGTVNLDGRYTVDRSGNIALPQIGTIQVAGVSFGNLTQYLRTQIGRTFRNFDLNVNVGQLRSIQIFIVGEARRPGSYTVSSLSTLVNALFASGGPNATGSLRAIQVKRGDRLVGTFDLYDLLLRGDKSKDITLQSGDVVYIPPAGRMLAIAGSVKTPAIFELKNEKDFSNVIELAGGLSTIAQSNQIRVERIGQQNGRSVLDIDLSSSNNAALMDGDVVIVSPIIDRFKDAVTLRGNVSDPRRFAWHPGMRIHDIIPDKEALLTRDYWERRNQLGMPQLDSTPDVRRYSPDEAVTQYYGLGLGPVKATSLFGLPDRDGNLIAPDNDQNVYGRRIPFGALSNATNPNQMAAASIAPSTSQARNQSNQAGEVSNGTPQNGLIALQSENGLSISGANVSVGAAVTATARRFPAKNSVVLNAPDVDWVYAVVQRLNPQDLTTQLIPFNLGKAVIDNDPSQNLELERGDVVTIFSTADIRVPQMQQSKYVRLEGEFAAAGTYNAKHGETLRQLVERVGGLTPNAYLYGSQFTRESTRVIQQQRLNEYAAELDRRIKLAEANSVNNALDPQDVVANIGGLQNARAAAMQLAQLRATGRIVLGVQPDAQTLSDIPDIPLEDGDAFTVPAKPSNIDVFGSVYTQNSFLYSNHMRAGDYLRKAGGVTRTGDSGRSFIVRADGSVISHQYSSGMFAGGFSSNHLFPGDAIVVPERVDKRPFLRNLVDWATVIGQFGIAVAAVNVLK